MKKSSKEIDEDFIHKSAEGIKDEDLDKVLNNKTAIDQKIGHLHKLKDKVWTLFQMLKDYRSKKYTETPWMSIAAIVFALLYVLNPLDIIPDFIPFVGYIDDASVIALTLKMMGSEVDAYRFWQEKQKASEKKTRVQTN